MNLPKPLQNLINQLTKLPKIGPKAAQRLAFHILKNNQAEKLAHALENLSNLKICPICNGLICLCNTKKRKQNKLCLVQSDMDLLAIEKTNKYQGLYHNIGSELKPNLDKLEKRLKNNKQIKEIIIASDPTTEGDITALFIKRQLTQAGFKNLNFYRPARGLPTGADLEYADEKTLGDSISSKKKI